MAFGNMMEQKLHTILLKTIQKTLRFSVFTKITMAIFGLAHMKMAHGNLTEMHLKNLNHNNKRKTTANVHLTKLANFGGNKYLHFERNFIFDRK